MTALRTDGLVRRAAARDAGDVARLYAALVSNPDVRVLPERLSELAADPATALFVFEDAAGVHGTGLASLCADAMFGRRPFAVVENVVVAPAHRGRGIGARLLHAMEDFCRAADCSRIMLLSAAGRERAHAFFERCGYAGGVKRGFVKYSRDFAAAPAAGMGAC